MLIVVERRETFHYYYPMGVHPPGDLTVTKKQAEKEALDPDANYTEDKGDFEIPMENEPEETSEENNTEVYFYWRRLPPYIYIRQAV